MCRRTTGKTAGKQRETVALWKTAVAILHATSCVKMLKLFNLFVELIDCVPQFLAKIASPCCRWLCGCAPSVDDDNDDTKGWLEGECEAVLFSCIEIFYPYLQNNLAYSGRRVRGFVVQEHEVKATTMTKREREGTYDEQLSVKVTTMTKCGHAVEA